MLAANRLFVKPLEILAIVPYWSIEEAEKCAKMTHFFINRRVVNGSDLAYETDDFKSLAYIGIMKAKQHYEAHGNKLKVEQCRGYIKSYTSEEARKKGNINKDAAFCRRDNNDDNAISESTEQNYNDKINDLLEFISNYSPTLLNYAKAYIAECSKDELKSMFGSHYRKLKKDFDALSKSYLELSKRDK